MANQKVFVATDEAKGQAKQLRLFALLAWIIAIGTEIFAVLKLIHNETLTWLIVAIVAILVLSLVGTFLWKKANRLDPASEKDKFRFFVQNQLGAIMAVLAFLPLVVLIFTNKDLDKKSKGIAGVVAVIALIAASIFGIDFNPPSVEKYTEQINAQTDIIKNINNGVDHVYWTPAGNKMHLYEDCQYLKNKEIGQGTVKEAWEARKIGDNEVCKVCLKRAEKDHGVTLDQTEQNEIAQESTQEAPADVAE